LKTYTIRPTSFEPGIKVHQDSGNGPINVVVGKAHNRFERHESKVRLTPRLAKTMKWRRRPPRRPLIMSADIADAPKGPEIDLQRDSEGRNALVLIDSTFNAPCSMEVEFSGLKDPRVLATGCTSRSSFTYPVVLAVVKPGTKVELRWSSRRSTESGHPGFSPMAATWDGRELKFSQAGYPDWDAAFKQVEASALRSSSRETSRG